MYPQPPDYELMDCHVLYVCTSSRHEDIIARIPPVCAALRLGLCIIQPLRGCTSYSVSAIQSNISYIWNSCQYCSLTRSKHSAVVSRRDTIMHNPRLRESSDRSLGLKSISYCASERYIHEGHGNILMVFLLTHLFLSKCRKCVDLHETSIKNV